MRKMVSPQTQCETQSTLLHFVGAISNMRFEVLTAVSVVMGRGTIVW